MTPHDEHHTQSLETWARTTYLLRDIHLLWAPVSSLVKEVSSLTLGVLVSRRGLEDRPSSSLFPLTVCEDYHCSSPCRRPPEFNPHTSKNCDIARQLKAGRKVGFRGSLIRHPIHGSNSPALKPHFPSSQKGSRAKTRSHEAVQPLIGHLCWVRWGKGSLPQGRGPSTWPHLLRARIEVKADVGHMLFFLPKSDLPDSL